MREPTREDRSLGALATALLALAASVLFGWTGCAVHTAVRDVAPPLDLPGAWSERLGEGALPERWWEALGDGELTTLVDKVLAQNLDLRRGWARLAQARAAVVQAGSGLMPQVRADFSPQVSYLSNIEKGRAVETTRLPLTASFDHELDIWGKVRSQRNAAQMDAAAARGDLEATAQALVGQLVGAWMDRAEQRALRGLLLEQERVAQTFLTLVQLRFGQGQAGAADVLQQRQQVASLRAQLPLVEARIALAEHRLAVLCGEPPQTPVPGQAAAMPALPPPPAIGLPSDLLRRRPDVRAAERRVVAADHRVGVAVADRFPSLRVGLTLGPSAGSWADFFSQWVTTLVGAISAPLVDGGRRSAEVRRTEAQRSELLTAFAQILLTALREVEDAIAQERQQRVYLGELAGQLELARQTVQQAESSFALGQTTFLQVLTALQAMQRIEQSVVSARRQLVGYRVQLYLALGGTWPSALSAPAGPLPLRNRRASE